MITVLAIVCLVCLPRLHISSLLYFSFFSSSLLSPCILYTPPPSLIGHFNPFLCSWDKAASSADVEQARVQEIIANIPEYSASEFHGRGIVMVAGGDYLRDAMVTIAAIRELRY